MNSKKTLKTIILLMAFCITNLGWSQDQMAGKLMMGYQGWFLAKGDNSAPNEWRHWFQSTVTPSAENFTVDMWPDMSEYPQKYNTQMTYSDGSNAQLFSSHDLSTTRKHFEWMRDYNIYGVHLQRFLGEIADNRFFRVRNKVLQNVMTSAVEYDRHFSVMYDISGVSDVSLYYKLTKDWEYLVDNYDILNAPGYVKEDGRPVVAIWGIGFKNRGLTPETAKAIIDYFHTNAAPKYRAYVMGGVPEGWRLRNGSSETGIGWTAIYNSLDMISPWSVGRYSTITGANSFKTNNIMPDLAECNKNGVDYMPVIWPGFSWLNLKNERLNAIPRNGGDFYWRQAYNAIQAGAKYIYVAMFDEVDEGTAMFKITETKAKLPVQGSDILVPLDIDGTSLPSDWYLKLADQTQKMLDGTIPLTSTIPIAPITLAGNGAEFISLQNVPLKMESNKTAIVKVTLKNTGTTTWTKSNGYMLGSQNPKDNFTWGLNRVFLDDGDIILPSQTKTFEFTITSPAIAGYYNFQWQMIKEGVEWFGSLTSNKSISVGQVSLFFDDCDSKSNWNPVGLHLNTTDQLQGFGCLESTGSNTDEYSKVFSTPYHANGTESGTVLQFWYYVSDVTLLSGNNQVEISSSGGPDNNEYNWSLAGLKNGWNFIQLNTNTAGKIGNPNLNAINWFRIYRFKTGVVTTRIDAIELLGDNLSINDFDTNVSLNLYPNPAETEVTLVFNLQQSSTISFTVVNVLGQVILQSENSQEVNTGNHTLKIPLQSLNAGVYMVVLNIDDKIITKRILKK